MANKFNEKDNYSSFEEFIEKEIVTYCIELNDNLKTKKCKK